MKNNQEQEKLKQVPELEGGEVIIEKVEIISESENIDDLTQESLPKIEEITTLEDTEKEVPEQLTESEVENSSEEIEVIDVQESDTPEKAVAVSEEPSYTIATEEANLEDYSEEQLKGLYSLMGQYGLVVAYVGFSEDVFHCYSIPQYGCARITIEQVQKKLGIVDESIDLQSNQSNEEQ